MTEPPDELAVAAALVTVVAAAGARAALCADPAPTGFGDGAAYRTMARGEPGAPPFNRRVLMPAIVRALYGDDALAGFRSVGLSSVAVTAIEAGLLSARVARSCGAPSSQTWLAGMLAGTLVPTMPHSTRMAVQIPTYNDQLAVALGGLWLLACFSRRRLAALGPLVALGAALTREQWILVVGAVLPLLPWAGPGRLLVAGAHLAALALATAIVLAQPAGPDGEVYPPSVALRRLASREGVKEILWGLGFAGGLLPVLLPAALRRAAERPEERVTLTALLRVVAVQTCLALVGGSDIPRLLYGGLPFLAAATVGVAVADREPWLAPVLGGTLVLWRPLAQLDGSVRAYEQFYLPYMHGLLVPRLAADAVRVLAMLTAVAAARLYRRRDRRRGPPGQPRPSSSGFQAVR